MFLLIGAMKSGTTALFDDVVTHPAIHAPSMKEPADLTDDAVLTEAGLARYLKIFDGAPREAWCAEASTAYTKLPAFTGVAARALALFGPELRLVFIGRDPVDRLRSHYRHDVAKGAYRGDLVQALEELPLLREVSRYDRQLAPWRAAFGDDALLVLRFDDYVADPEASVERVWSHLGLAPVTSSLGAQRNASAQKRVPRGLLRAAIQSDLYSRTLRRLLPEKLRAQLKAVLVPKGQGGFADALPPALERALREELAADCVDFEALASR
ncbi:MAG: sulfotransferase [Pseudomonadota bacterium]